MRLPVHPMNSSNENLRLQRYITLLALFLFLIKLLAWHLTHSVAILTDALESIVNVVSGFVGWYGLYVSSRPRDREHPYGHGKVELVTAALEGMLITVSGVFIIREAVLHLYHPQEVHQLDLGLLLIALTAAVNFSAGWISVKTGKRNHSPALVAGGKHLMSDTYTTLGIIVGLGLLYLTSFTWIDSVVALIFAIILVYTGFRIIRESIGGMMDEADKDLLNTLIEFLNQNRSENWVDLHNLRVIKYGSRIHIDAHLTIPWYLNIHEGHREIDRLSALVTDHFGDRVEMFIHTDGCMEFSCAICSKAECPQRLHPFQKRVAWTVDNISADQKHQQQTV